MFDLNFKYMATDSYVNNIVYLVSKQIFLSIMVKIYISSTKIQFLQGVFVCFSSG